ncbi:MAG: hypothetical protein JO133_06480, partial [Burkholderiaceae bacterium]|nr:hypothetical protein [Burkholderiaceae bacterium]
TVVDAGEERLELSFVQPQWAVTPGQSVVLYDRDICLGGAVIDSTGGSGAPATDRDPGHSGQADRPLDRGREHVASEDR